jgi:hypothetical protein
MGGRAGCVQRASSLRQAPRPGLRQAPRPHPGLTAWGLPVHICSN